jgi:hypothetical protein
MFSKKDLKTGYVLKFTDESLGEGVVLLDTANGDIVAGDRVWFPLDSKSDIELFGPKDEFSSHQVAEVACPRNNVDYLKAEHKCNREILWKREEKTEQHNVFMLLQIEKIESTIKQAQEQIEQLKNIK